MAFTSGYEYDLFISYARVDDAELTSTGRGWVSEFVLRLRSALQARLGGQDSLRIFFDLSSLGADHKLADLEHAAARSAVFLAIASPSYANREWTRKELAAFASTATDESRRLFSVEVLPLDEGSAYPEPLQSHKRAKFWEVDEPHSTTPMSLMPDGQGPYRARIHDLAAQIKERLMVLNTSGVVGPIADDVADETARRKKGVVCLAQTTDDLEEDRLQVKRYLEQFGFLVVPRNDLPQGGDAFKAAVTEELRGADVYVHLLGPRAGRRPPDLPEGYARAQFEAARAAGTRIMLWRRPDLDLASVSNPAHLALLNDASVSASGLETFKADIRRHLENRHVVKRPPPPPSTVVFINADQSDFEIARTVQQEFAARNLSTFIPMFSSDAAASLQDLKDNLTECDVLVFLYGRAPETWVRQQLRFFSKLRPGAKARVVAVLVGPPEDKPEDFGVMLPDLRRFTVQDGWKVTPVLEMIEGLDA